MVDVPYSNFDYEILFLFVTIFRISSNGTHVGLDFCN